MTRSHRHLGLIALLSSLVVSPAASAAAQQPFGEIGGWKISKVQAGPDTSQCIAMLNDGLDVLTIIYAPLVNRMFMGFSLFDGADFAVGDTIQVSTRFVSTPDGEVDGYQAPAGVRSGIERIPQSRLVWQAQERPDASLDLLSRHRYVGFYLPDSGRKLVIMKLDDSAEAIALLRRCASSLKAN